MTEKFDKKMRQVIAEAVAGLDPDDRDERIAYCRETGEQFHREEDACLECS